MEDVTWISVTCSDCKIKWTWACPVCKATPNLRTHRGLKKLRPKPEMIKPDMSKHINGDGRKIKVPSIIIDQPLPITIENYFIKTFGIFDEIKELPNDVKSIFKSNGSEYWTNEAKDILIRKSNHWGRDIKNCCWYLNGYTKMHCGVFMRKYEFQQFIGIIKISELEPNKK